MAWPFDTPTPTVDTGGDSTTTTKKRTTNLPATGGLIPVGNVPHGTPPQNAPSSNWNVPTAVTPRGAWAEKNIIQVDPNDLNANLGVKAGSDAGDLRGIASQLAQKYAKEKSTGMTAAGDYQFNPGDEINGANFWQYLRNGIGDDPSAVFAYNLLAHMQPGSFDQGQADTMGNGYTGPGFDQYDPSQAGKYKADLAAAEEKANAPQRAWAQFLGSYDPATASADDQKKYTDYQASVGQAQSAAQTKATLPTPFKSQYTGGWESEFTNYDANGNPTHSQHRNAPTDPWSIWDAPKPTAQPVAAGPQDLAGTKDDPRFSNWGGGQPSAWGSLTNTAPRSGQAAGQQRGRVSNWGWW